MAPWRQPDRTDLHYSATFVEMGGDIGLILPSPVLVPSFFPQSWVPNTATSRWVWASPPGSNPGYTEPGVYDYLMTFDLTGFDPASALITGSWAADNQGLDILVNGISTQQTALETAFTGFTIDPNNLLAQVNIVDFRVRNTLVNPAGIQIQFTQQSADAVPEPSTLTLFGLSLVGLVGLGAGTTIGRRYGISLHVQSILVPPTAQPQAAKRMARTFRQSLSARSLHINRVTKHGKQTK